MGRGFLCWLRMSLRFCAARSLISTWEIDGRLRRGSERSSERGSPPREGYPESHDNDAVAQVSLGRLYYNGQGLTQDYAQSAAWFRNAAEQGNADAQMELGYSYELGHGAPQDDTHVVT